MVSLVILAGLFVFAINGLVYLGIKHEREQLKRDYKASISQHQVVSISRARTRRLK